MAEINAKLRAAGLPPVTCRLYENPPRLHPDPSILALPFVANEGAYVIELQADEHHEMTGARFTLTVNGESIPAYATQAGELLTIVPYYEGEKASRFTHALPFINAFGFVRFTLEVNGPGMELTLTSDYLQVAMKDNDLSADLRAMATYVNEHKDKLRPTDPSSDWNDEGLTALSEASMRVHFFEQALLTYETHFAFFSMHAKTRTVEKSRRDGVKKLRNFDAKTLHYVISHPEELMTVRADAGFALGLNRYAPKHTLVTYRVASLATPENLAIAAFLQNLAMGLNELKRALRQTAQKAAESDYLPTGYIPSTETIIESIRANWIELLKKVGELQNQLKKIVKAYGQILPAADQPLSERPKATPVFTREPHYRLFYTLIAQWFTLPALDLHPNNGLMFMLANSRLYEYFVLTRFIDSIIKSGFVLEKAYQYHYVQSGQLTFYEDQGFANTFVFRHGGTTYTLYYEPIIGALAQAENDLHLRRITRMSLRDKDSATGTYVPDYVFKVESEGQETYWIADAKYSTEANVRRFYAKELAFRYLLTVRPTTAKASLNGLYIYYGKRLGGSDQLQSFWDLLPEGEASEPTFAMQGVFPTTD